jgi:hypothetical protein
MGAYRLFDFELAKSYTKQYNNFILRDLDLENEEVYDDHNVYLKFNQYHEKNIMDELCSSGNVEKFNECFNEDNIANLGILYLCKSYVCRESLHAAIESENIEMIKYVINNAEISELNFTFTYIDNFYKPALEVLIEKSKYPTIKLIEILKFLFYNKDLSIVFRYILILLFIKIGKFDIIKDDVIVYLKTKETVIEHRDNTLIDRVIWFSNDEDFYNKMGRTPYISYKQFRISYKSLYYFPMIDLRLFINHY